MLFQYKRLDVIFVQETHAVQTDLKIWRSQWGGEIKFANATTQSKGVMILLRKGLQCDVKELLTDTNGRYIITEVVIDDTKLILCNIYAPNVDSPEFFLEVYKHVESFDNRNIIWGGDFNFVIDNNIDRMRSYTNNDNARNSFLESAELLEIVDVWRIMNPDIRQFSCCRPNVQQLNEKFSRLDMFFISTGLLNLVTKCNMQTGYCSDHSFVVLELNLAPEARGPGYWKFNNSHLKDKQFVTGANAIIQEAMLDTVLSPLLKWEMIKGRFIEYSRKYSIDKAKEKNSQFHELEEKLQRLKLVVEHPESSPSDKEDYSKTQTELNNLIKEKANGALIRSRTKFYHEGERSSKYYFSLEKNRAKSKIMTQIRNQQEETIFGQENIMKEQVRYFSKLYKSNRQVNFQLENKGDKKISEQSRKQLDKELTLDELANAVMQMPNNKSPGIDGLTIEVYKTFWKFLGPSYYKAILEAKQKGKLHLVARRGVITLIPKKDRDVRVLDNWRPITMLTCDYKILAKAIALRMQPLLDQIISEDQTGFIKGRNIATNLRKTIEVIQYTKKRNIPAIIVTIDYKKCFDYLEHSAIFGSLKYFNFGENFIEWVKILFQDLELCTQNNGHMSEYFSASRSVLQGSNAAATLFVICGQVLHDMLANNENIKGINMNDINMLLSQFADDTTLYLSYDEITLLEVVRTLDILYKHTGLIVNYDKTNVYRVGSLAGSQAKIYTTCQLNWTNEPIKMLGVQIPIDLDRSRIEALNFDNVLVKIENVTNNWIQRSATLSGKVLIVNTLIASLLVYKMQVFQNVSQVFVRKFDKLIKAFLWEGGSTKISHKVLSKDKNQGGLRLVDVVHRQTALRAQWIVQIINNEFWSTLFYNLLKCKIGERIWECNLKGRDVKYIIDIIEHPFWAEVLTAWTQYNFVMPRDVSQIFSQFIWCNSFIRIENKPFIMHTVFTAGLYRIEQLYDGVGAPKSFDMLNREYNNCLNWFQYTQIWHAIPYNWKRIIATQYNIQQNYFIESKFQKIVNEHKISNIIYSALIKDDSAVEKRKERWERKLNCSITCKQYHKAFKNIYVLTIATKIRDFQYRLLIGALVTNAKLKLWRIKDSDLCTFCDSIAEDEIHLFCECHKVKNMWNALRHYIQLNDLTGVAQCLTWSNYNIIFNLVHPKPANVVNFLVLIVKQLIYRQRCLLKPLNSTLVENEIESIYEIECNIAKKKQKMRFHVQKWSCLKNIEYSEQDYIEQYVTEC